MPRPKSNQSLETRVMIIRTAEELFMEHGYRAVSTRMIADGCGLTQPALYHHFKDKQSLYVEVLRHVCEGTRQALVRIIGETASMHDCLIAVTYEMMANHPQDLGRMFRDIRHEMDAEPQRTIYAMWKDAYLDPLVSIFERGRREGRLRDIERFGVNPETSARLLMALINQSIAAQASSPAPSAAPRSGIASGVDSEDWERQAAMLVNVLLYGLSDVGPPSVQ
ncbi:TetR/AcrR family transcriptional regulator [Paenibacillus sp. GCM10023250]|uniref:TetR/AcrR family transcriptional regulator n=1 Tax=Paenibacillus sp. GCM10023250 TaxID=3252648 RepID=UPI00360D9AC5